jgi:hypothetical protein
MSLTRFFAFGAWLSLAGTQGCSSSKALDAGAGAGAGGSVTLDPSSVAGEAGEAFATPEAGASSGGALGTGGAAACVAPGYHVDSTAITINEVQALLHDPSGAAVSNLSVQVCGTDQCFNGSTNASGKTDVTPRTALTLPAFKYGDGFDFAELAIMLGSAKSQDLGSLVALPLPAYADGAAFPKKGNITNGDVTLSIASGTTIEHDRLTYEDDSELVFRTVQIPVADSAKALDPSFGFELAYAVAPLGSTFCPPAGLTLKNVEQWAAGTAVEVFVQGLDVAENWAPYGSWVKVADASVSTDGKSIVTTSGGITILSSIAVRRKP